MIGPHELVAKGLDKLDDLVLEQYTKVLLDLQSVDYDRRKAVLGSALVAMAAVAPSKLLEIYSDQVNTVPSDEINPASIAVTTGLWVSSLLSAGYASFTTTASFRGYTEANLKRPLKETFEMCGILNKGFKYAVPGALGVILISGYESMDHLFDGNIVDGVRVAFKTTALLGIYSIHSFARCDGQLPDRKPLVERMLDYIRPKEYATIN